MSKPQSTPDSRVSRAAGPMTILPNGKEKSPQSCGLVNVLAPVGSTSDHSHSVINNYGKTLYNNMLKITNSVMPLKIPSPAVRSWLPSNVL
ncbi:hypothetical protein VA599_06095 [Chromobacterium sp. TRC.1.1.SA]|uniref:Uncharacterized protein n=1 Tax=Chromobacterium indicum TaxID=3110228 RepID=A0ABV0CGK8_9NEIS